VAAGYYAGYMRGWAFTASVDGGVHWTRPSLAPFGIAALTCPSALVCVGVGERDDPAADKELAPITGPAGAAPIVDGRLSREGTGLRGIRSLGDVTCRDESLCFAAGNRLIRSDDLGRSWNRVPLPSYAQVPSAVECVPAGTCVVASMVSNPRRPRPNKWNGILVTRDGRSGWSPEALPGGPAAWVPKIACGPSGACIALTQRGDSTYILRRNP